MLIYLIALVIIGIVYKICRDAVRNLRNQQVGTELENRVACELRKQQRFYGGDILTNVYIPTGGKISSTELDVVYILRNMIFVFECKNYNAKIGLDPTNPMRFSAEYKSGDMFFFRSPILQNAGHIKNVSYQLQKLFNSGAYEIYNVVVFGDNADISQVSSISWREKLLEKGFRNIGISISKDIKIIRSLEVANIIRFGINGNAINLFDSKTSNMTKQMEMNASNVLRKYINVGAFEKIKHIIEIKIYGNNGGY